MLSRRSNVGRVRGERWTDVVSGVVRIGVAFYCASGVTRMLHALIIGAAGWSSAAQLLVTVLDVVASVLVLRAWRGGDVLACALSVWRVSVVLWMIAGRYFVVEGDDVGELAMKTAPLTAMVWLACWSREARASYRAMIHGGRGVQIVWWACGSWGWSMAAGAVEIWFLAASGSMTMPVPMWLIVTSGLAGAGVVVCALNGLMGRHLVTVAWGCATCAVVSGAATAVEWCMQEAPGGSKLFLLGAAHVIVFVCGSAAAMRARRRAVADAKY
ncbi:MAG: hypothetical protein N2595_07785 [bacterium]|nr:hypothetical protein [bacterium]